MRYSTPTMVFSRFTSESDRRYRGWRAWLDQLNLPSITEAVLPERGNSGEHGIWRLISSNYRDLARSSRLYGSAAEAQAHVLELQRAAERIEVSVVHGRMPGDCAWYGALDGAVVITSARWYEGAAGIRAAAAASLEALPLARFAESPEQPFRPPAASTAPVRPRGVSR